MTKTTHAVFRALTGAGPDAELRDGEPGNALRHVAALSMTKSADGLIDPKLVLSWLLTYLGAPALFVGLLVPIREAGALLPQIFFAPPIRAMGRRKWAWVAGSAAQGGAVAAIVVIALLTGGALAGTLICAALAVLAVARSLCSVSYKDVLGKTVARTRRGAVTGFASSASAVVVVIFAGILMTELVPRAGLVIGALALAALLWIASAAVFATLREEDAPGDPREGSALSQFALLREDPQLVRFIVTRGLLVGTALAPPFLVLLASESGQGGLESLGALVLASAVSAFASSWIWGRMADRSSRRVLILTGLVGAAALLAGVALSLVGLAGRVWAMPGVLFVLMTAYHGVRQGRSTYLVDMAPEDDRAAYTAVSNTVIGVILLLVGLAGAGVSGVAPEWALALFAAASLAASAVALGLEEVEE